MTDPLSWALPLIAAILEHEDTHGRDGSCLGPALDRVPEDMRLMARGYRLGLKAQADPDTSTGMLRLFGPVR